jgi:hypothetical protein
MNYAALVFSHSITPRLQYVIDFISQYYGLPIRLTSDEEKYANTPSACRINYSYHRILKDEIWIHSHVLLFESAVRQVKVECFEHNGYKVFFRTEGDIGFDLFAAIFYLLTRYEEYLPHHRDIYGRYAHQNALAFREEFLHQPLIDIWLEDFRKVLGVKNPEFRTTQARFTFEPTYDIDIAWCFLNKGFKRNAGAILQLFLKAKWGRMMERIRVLRGKKPDPFDAYEWMEALHQQYQLHPVYFFLVAHVKGKYDKNIDVENVAFQALIEETAARYKTGLHPSWSSGDLQPQLGKEKKYLEQLIQKEVDTSRQHYIRFDLPTTYRRLLNVGITHDYSMGYGTINGFRASVARPFYWYDLKSEQMTRLLVHPFCFMDSNAYYEEQLGVEEAFRELMAYYQYIHSVNGVMTTIWHNSMLGTAEEFEGWREMYENFVRAVCGGRSPARGTNHGGTENTEETRRDREGSVPLL